jgi:hypothetical protein
MAAPAPDKRTIPELRPMLLKIAEELETGMLKRARQEILAMELRQIERELWKNPPARKRASVVHHPLSKAEKKRIRQYANGAGENVHLQDIATMFNTNIGRVSEALHETRS